jgi:hypothetical protein
MKYILSMVCGLLILWANTIHGQSKSQGKEEKPLLFIEYGRGVSLINTVKFQEYNPPFFQFFSSRRLSVGILKNNKKFGLELNFSLQNVEDLQEDFYFNYKPFKGLIGGLYLVDIVKKEKLSVFVGGMLGFSVSSTRIFRFEDDLFHTSMVSGGSLLFRSDAHYYFLKNIYAVFSLNTAVLDIGNHERFSFEDPNIFSNRSYESGLRFSIPVIGYINANLALGVRF